MKKKNNRRNIKKNQKKWWVINTILVTFLNIVMIGCLVLAYGPNQWFKEYFISTAYTTATHQYYANFLYSAKDVQGTLQGMTIVEASSELDLSSITVSDIIPTTFVSASERQVLERKQGDLYKVVAISGSGWKGYMTVIYDPTRIDVGLPKGFPKDGQYVTDIAKRNNAIVAINSTGFRSWNSSSFGGYPQGSVVKDGKIVYKSTRSSKWGGGVVGFDGEGKLILSKLSMKDAIAKFSIKSAVEFGPFLVVNGKPTTVNKGVGGIQPRTFIGQRADGVVLFFTVDGRNSTSLGITFNGMINLLKKYQVVNAANMDGGASTTLAIKGKLKNNPAGYSGSGQREVPVIWMMK